MAGVVLHRARARRRGFSLIEIMAVMMILAVLLVSVIPAVDGLVPKYRLRGGAREVAGLIEEAQGAAISNRREYKVVIDLDDDTYHLILPPAETEAPATATDASTESPEAAAKKAAMRPADDVEHGPPPPDPTATEAREARPDEPDAQTTPKRLPDDVAFVAVVVGDEEKTAGSVTIPFTHLGGSSAVIVGLRLSQEEDKQAWLKFNALTRTVEYHDERPTAQTLEGGQ